MGLIGSVLAALFGGGRNVVAETAQVFMPNAEAEALRESADKNAALRQFGREFSQPRQGFFDRVIDALNRLPRPMLAFGTLGLFVAAMVDPIWFAARMQGVALIPEPLWWLMGAIVSFYFGARAQAKGQEFQRSIAETVGRAAEVTRNIAALQALDAGAAMAQTAPDDNPALADWRAAQNG